MEDPAMIVALAIAGEVCQGCAIAEQQSPLRKLCCAKKPCPLFHPDNFYYDRQLGRFWCHNWIDVEGNDKPVQKPVSKPLSVSC